MQLQSSMWLNGQSNTKHDQTVNSKLKPGIKHLIRLLPLAHSVCMSVFVHYFSCCRHNNKPSLPFIVIS